MFGFEIPKIMKEENTKKKKSLLSCRNRPFNFTHNEPVSSSPLRESIKLSFAEIRTSIAFIVRSSDQNS